MAMIYVGEKLRSPIPSRIHIEPPGTNGACAILPFNHLPDLIFGETEFALPRICALIAALIDTPVLGPFVTILASVLSHSAFYSAVAYHAIACRTTTA